MNVRALRHKRAELSTIGGRLSAVFWDFVRAANRQEWGMRAFMLIMLIAMEFVMAADISPEAMRIHREAILIDGHNDFPWEMRTKKGMSFDDVDMRQPI